MNYRLKAFLAAIIVSAIFWVPILLLNHFWENPPKSKVLENALGIGFLMYVITVFMCLKEAVSPSKREPLKDKS